MFPTNTALIALTAASLAATGTPPMKSADCSSHPAPTENIAAQLAKFRPVKMPFDTTGLSAREVSMVRKLVEAGQYLESIYWRQSDPEGLALYKTLANCPGQTEKDIRHFLMINGNRYGLLEGNKPFLANTTYQPGAALYPAGITRKEIDDYIAGHPEKKTEIMNPWTVVKRQGSDF